MNLLKFEPIPQERVWGGRSLEIKFGRKLPRRKTIGESWEICDRPEAQSVVAEGEFKGQTIAELLRRFPIEIMGRKLPDEFRFPILVKILDCRQRLSLQVHPDAETAVKLGGEPKCEAWYFLETDPSAKFIAGTKPNIDSEAILENLRKSSLEKCVHFFNSRKDSFITIACGCVHALGAGNIVLEIQQNSDTTFRLYDWRRPDVNGKLRELHIEQSLESINFGLRPSPLSTSELHNAGLCKTATFSISIVKLGRGESIVLESSKSPKIISVVNGHIESDSINLARAESALVPFCTAAELKAPDGASILLTDGF